MPIRLVEPVPITFEEAIRRTEHQARYLLLGNGFSISARPSFAYQSLYRRAGAFSPPVAKLFRDHGTEDFEHVLSVIGRQLANEDTPEVDRVELRRQEAEIRAGFIASLSNVHPDNSTLLRTEESLHCAEFLEHFAGRRRTLKLHGRVYTTNYDLLLYWVVAKHGRKLWAYDSHISSFGEKRFGVWNPEKIPDLVYLHGAVHLYDYAGGQAMLRYDGRHSLIEQTRHRLNRGSFPAIVSEGTSEAKTARIARSAYLTWARESLRAGLQNRNGVLFTFGHSLNERDAHIIRGIGSGRISAVYVGAWGGLRGSQGSVLRDWTARWCEARLAQSTDHPLDVFVYDTSEFSPWR